MTFDQPIDRRGTNSVKWDMMEKIYGIPPDTGLAMWVADMEFRPPACVQQAVEKMAAHGVYGYFGDDTAYLEAIRWWMRSRHGWDVDAEAIFTTHGLVNGFGICLDAFTAPGDGIVLMTPVYHAFARVIKAAGRNVVECPLKTVAGRYEMDFAAWDRQMTGRESLLVLCSPHNPGGRVWTAQELQGVADFCTRHNLLLLSDDVHHDLVFPGKSYVPIPRVAPQITDRLIMMTAASKTFNIAGGHTGNVILLDEGLRARFAARMMALGISPNAFGMQKVTSAYSPEGAEWLDALLVYLQENRRIFDAGVNAIPGLASMPLEATYLAWVDFSATGMDRAEFTARVEKAAGIATNHGFTFGAGGESFLRFNIGAPRAQIVEAVRRLHQAFGDLQ